LDHRCAALRAVLFRTLDDPDLRQRVCVPASGVAIASEEPRAPPRSDDGQVPFLAQVAFADVILLPEGGFDLLTDRLAVRLEDLVPRRLRPESNPFHFLDEGAFAVRGRRFRAILADRYRTDAVQGFARRESRKDRLSDGPIRIVFPPSRILDPVTLGKEELASEIDLRFRRLSDGIRGDRGEEAPHDELVNGPMVVPLHLFSRNPLDRVDRRVV